MTTLAERKLGAKIPKNLQLFEQYKGNVLSEFGVAAHELVRVNQLIESHLDPKIEFSLSRRQFRTLSKRRWQLSEMLNLPKHEVYRGEIIDRFREALTEGGMPHSKSLNDGNYHSTNGK